MGSSFLTFSSPQQLTYNCLALLLWYPLLAPTCFPVLCKDAVDAVDAKDAVDAGRLPLKTRRECVSAPITVHLTLI